MSLMSTILRLAMPCTLLLAACAAQTVPPPSASRPPEPPAKVAEAPAKPAPPAAKSVPAPAPAPAPAPVKPAPSNQALAPAPVKPAPAKQPPAPAKPAPAPLDLTSLEQRLKDTGSIGVLTKLSLKNQVDDLVGRFRAYHHGERPPTLADLRPAFDLLLMKVLALLQDHDPSLAHDINASRDAIWGVLTDPRKLAELS